MTKTLLPDAQIVYLLTAFNQPALSMAAGKGLTVERQLNQVTSGFAMNMERHTFNPLQQARSV